MKGFYFILIFVSLHFPSFAQHFPVHTFSEKGHNIFALDYSPKGDFIISGGDDYKVIAWDVANKRKHLVFGGHEDVIMAVKFDEEGEMFAAGDKSGKLTLHNVQTGRLKFEVQAHEEQISAVDINNKYDFVATASFDGTIKFWDVNSGFLEKTISAHGDKINDFSFSPDEENFITTGADGRLSVWDISTGQIIKTILAHDTWVRSASFSPDQRYILTAGDDKTIKLWELGTWNLIGNYENHKNWVNKVVFSADSKHFVSGGFDSKVFLWDKDIDLPINEFKQEGKFVSGLAFSPDNHYLVISGYHHALNLWDVSKLNLYPDQQVSQLVNSKDINPDYIGNLKIDLIQPAISRGQTFNVMDEMFMIKGKVNHPEQVREILINGEPAQLLADGYFQKEVRLAYLDNAISIKALGEGNKYVEESINLYRIFDQKSQSETHSLTRSGKDYALIIATNEYEEMPDLTNPVYDAKTISQELISNYNFEVETVFNPTKSELLTRIRNYGKKMFSDEDQLFIFIAGHGVFDEVFSDGYIVCADSKKDDEIKSSYISHSSLRTIINNIPCKHIFLTMDVCFGGTFDPYTSRSRGMAAQYGSVDQDEFIKRKLKYKTRLYLTSGGKEYVPDGRPNFHSPFARNLIAAMRSYGGEDGILTYSEILSYVEKATPEPRNGEFGENEPGSDFMFIFAD